MPVTKSIRECYEVRGNGRSHEWANITLHCWDRPANVGTPHECTYYCGEITIQSSFGTWGYIWTACARPFKEFLCGIEFDYAFTKFMGLKLDRFDGEATLREIRRDIIERRRSGSLDKSEARDAWGLVGDEDERIASDDRTAYGYAMWDIGSRLDDRHPMRDYFNDPSGWPNVTRHDSQAVGFWRELWPVFVQALRDEAAAPAIAAQQAA